MATTISVRDLTKDYKDVRAVGPISFDVRAGEFVSLLGPSGCGKTTTLRLIAGFEEASDGIVLLGGSDVTGQNPEEREVGFVFQSYALFPHLNVRDNIAFGLKLRKESRQDINTKIERVLDLVGLPGLESRRTHELSAGQQQRVALARSIVLEPSVLLMDEPFSNLDLRLRLEMRSEVSRLQREVGFTTVFVTHDQGEALSMSDRVILLSQGSIQQQGTPRELYETPRTRFVADFLGSGNIFRGIVKWDDDGPILQLADGGDIRVDGPPPQGTIGEEGIVTVRKEKCTVGTTAPDDSSNVLHGTVSSKLFSGQRIEFHVQTDSGLLITADVQANPQAHEIEVDDPAFVSFSDHAVQWLEVD